MKKKENLIAEISFLERQSRIPKRRTKKQGTNLTADENHCGFNELQLTAAENLAKMARTRA